MAIDAGIYNALSQPRKSAFDYAREFEDQDMQREQMGMARQQNALALRTGQQKADEYTRGVEAQNALSAYLSSAPDLGTEQGVAGLYKAAPTLASGALKDYGERKKTGAANAKTEFETRTAKRTQAIADIAALNSPEEAAQSMRSHLANGDIDEVKFQSLMSTLPKDPAQFPTWQRNMVRSIMDAAKREELDQRARNDLIGPDGKVNQPLLTAKKQVAQAGASRLNVNTVQEKEENKAVGKFLGEQYATIQQAGIGAQAKLDRASRMEQLLGKISTGKFEGVKKEAASVAQAFGITIDPNLGDKEAFEALSNQLALEARNPSGGAGMPGAMSDKDREFLVQITPNLTKTADGNRTIIETAKKLARRDGDVARLSREYRKKNGTLDEGFFEELRQYSEANPLFEAGAKPTKPAKGAPAGSFSDAEKERRYQEWKAKQK